MPGFVILADWVQAGFQRHNQFRELCMSAKTNAAKKQLCGKNENRKVQDICCSLSIHGDFIKISDWIKHNFLCGFL